MALNNTAIGGHIRGQLLNHLFYPDDMCLISFSLAGMQELLNVCYSYSIEHSLLYNGNKSYSLCFRPTFIKFERPCFYLGEKVIPKVPQYKHLCAIYSPVYTCFLDASKAFDKINHFKLFRKLLDRKTPIVIVRILLFWYSKQTVCVKWGRCIADYFSISNDGRKGGILSPKLFSIYVDDLSDKLVESKVGCSIDNYLCMNHVMYADDICLMAPSPATLQELINICYDISIRYDSSFNSSKSYCMVFKPKSYKLSCPPFYMDSQVLKYADNIKYFGFTFSSDQKDDNDIHKV